MLADIIAEHFGYDVPTDSQESVVSVGTAVTTVLLAQARRMKLEVSNCGTLGNIFLGRTNGVAANSGFMLAPGANYVLDYRSDAREVGKPLFAVGDNAAAALYVREVLVVA